MFELFENGSKTPFSEELLTPGRARVDGRQLQASLDATAMKTLTNALMNPRLEATAFGGQGHARFEASLIDRPELDVDLPVTNLPSGATKSGHAS
jgi:hypothetical protein